MKILNAMIYSFFMIAGSFVCVYASEPAPVLPFTLPQYPRSVNMLPQSLVTPGGYPVWLYEHHESSLVTLTITFLDAGSKNEISAEEDGSILLSDAMRDGKKGLLKLLQSLLEEGAGPYSGEAFKKFLLENHIRFSGDVSRDTFTFTISMPAHKLKEGLDVVRIVLTDLHLRPEDVHKMQERLSVMYKHELEDPVARGFEELQRQMFGENHPYTQSTQTYLDHLSHITPSDLRDYIHDHFSQDRIMVAACGPISKVSKEKNFMTQQEFLQALDETFSELSNADRAPKTIPVKFQNLGSMHHVAMEIPQSNIIFAHPGLNRDDPDFMAMELAINVFGNGDFGARLMHRIREEAGLVYGISMNQWGRKDGSLILGTAATRFENVHNVIEMIKEEWAKFIKQGITEKEFKTEQQRMIASLPLRLGSSENIVNTLATMQYYNLGHEYLQNRNDTIKKLTRQRINAMLKERLKPEHLTFITVGRTPLNDAPASSMSAPAPNHEEAAP